MCIEFLVAKLTEEHVKSEKIRNWETGKVFDLTNN